MVLAPHCTRIGCRAYKTMRGPVTLAADTVLAAGNSGCGFHPTRSASSVSCELVGPERADETAQGADRRSGDQSQYDQDGDEREAGHGG